MKIESVDTRAIRVPLEKSYHESKAGIDTFNHVIASISTENHTGVGEADFLSLAQNSASIVTSILNRTVIDEIVGMDAFNVEEIVHRVYEETKLVLSPESTAGAMSCIDLALWDLQGKALDLPVYKLLGGKVTDTIDVSYTLSAAAPEEMAEAAREMIDYGYRTIVVKAGRDGLEIDRERMKQVRNRVGNGIEIRVDINGGYADAEEAIEAIKIFEEYDVEYVEQPIERGEVEDMKKIRDSIDVPVVADESLVTVEDAHVLAENKTFDIFNIKPTKCGGLHNSCKIAAVAESAGIPCLVGGHPQQEIARQASRHFAASRMAVNCGYANEGPGPASQSLESHITKNTITYDDVSELDGCVSVPDEPGLGVELDTSAINRYTVTE